MNGRRLNIGIRSAAERSKAIRHALHAARAGGVPQEAELYFENVNELREILTEKRLEILITITQHQPESISALAVLLGRDYKNVSMDIKLLETLGLVKLEDSGTGRARMPLVPYDEIRLTIDLRQAAAA